MPVGARCHDDGVLGAGIDHNDRRAAPARNVGGPVQADAHAFATA